MNSKCSLEIQIPFPLFPLFPTMLFSLALLLLPALSKAQRPSHASLCDYYTTQRYGDNSTANQVKLLESIFAVCTCRRLNAGQRLRPTDWHFQPRGICRKFGNLRPYFDGTIPSTNLNNQPVGIDWLDGGRTKDVFTLFLTGQTSTIQLTNGSNEA